MIQAKGFAAMSSTTALVPFSFDRREPREHDVLIDIKFSGICHSDIHQARNEWGGSMYPMVPGHEIAGVVKAVGSKVTKHKIGDHVGIGRRCRRSPHQQHCITGHQSEFQRAVPVHPSPAVRD